MTRYFALALLLLTGSAAPLPARAQDMARALDAVPRNSVVRLHGPELRRLRGRIGEVVGDTVFVRSESRRVAVPISGITMAEVATDRDHVRGMLNGARIGAVVGGVVGAALVTSACDGCSGSQHVQFAALGFGIGAIYFAAPGGLVGLAIGTQNWRPVHPPAYRARLAPAAGGRMAVGISFAAP
jgi:hypothetical protein